MTIFFVNKCYASSRHWDLNNFHSDTVSLLPLLIINYVLKEGAPGYCHFPEYTPEYFKQLTAEQLITKVVKTRILD